MNKGSAVSDGSACAARASGSYAKCSQMSKKVSDANHVSHAAQGPGPVTTLGQELKERILSITSASSLPPRTHQRRWSADFCRCGTSPTIIVKKSVKEPQPPQRGASLLRPHTASHPSIQRYSCPPIGIFRSPTHSSTSSSSTSSCSSPPPVKTSDITGRDPLGWKLRPKSSSTSPRARNKRLSLQIPLPVTFSDHKSSPAPDSSPASQPDPTPKTKPAPRPKPLRRHHSETSAFLRSLENPLPVVILEELCNVQLKLFSHLDESDDVFSEGDDKEKQQEEKATQSCKTPPPVPEKNAMARQIAQLIAHSRRCRRPVTAKVNQEENIYTSWIKPKSKHSHQTEGHSNLRAKKTGLRLDTSCDRERTTPRFPG